VFFNNLKNEFSVIRLGANIVLASLNGVFSERELVEPPICMLSQVASDKIKSIKVLVEEDRPRTPSDIPCPEKMSEV